jgi:prophage tail gpP-like protein
MSVYKTQQFETFGDIARKNFGSEDNAHLIREANSHIANSPDSSGVLGVPALVDVFIPDLIPVTTAPNPTNPDEMTLTVNGQQVKHWSSNTLRRGIGELSQVSFVIPFDSFNADVRALFRPFTYRPVELFIGSEKQFSGTMISRNPQVDPNKSVLSFGAYSKPGILNDCTVSAKMLPAEFNNQNLQQIAAKLSAPFGIDVDARSDVGTAIDRTSIAPGEKILPFIIKHAQQKNLVVSDSESGALVLQRAITEGEPVSYFQEGLAPLINIAPQFNEQEYYSDITGISPTILGFLGGEDYTVKNTLLKTAFRPFVFQAPDVDNGTLEGAVKAKMSRMFGAVCSYTLNVVGWRDLQGELWRENTLVDILAPSAYIEKRYRFIVKDVIFSQDENKKTAQLTVVMPGAYSGNIPATLPWDS